MAEGTLDRTDYENTTLGDITPAQILASLDSIKGLSEATRPYFEYLMDLYKFKTREDIYKNVSVDASYPGTNDPIGKLDAVLNTIHHSTVYLGRLKSFANPVLGTFDIQRVHDHLTLNGSGALAKTSIVSGVAGKQLWPVLLEVHCLSDAQVYQGEAAHLEVISSTSETELLCAGVYPAAETHQVYGDPGEASEGLSIKITAGTRNLGSSAVYATVHYVEV